MTPKPSPSPMDEMKPDQIAFEKFLLDKNMSNEKEDDAWGIPGYKHPQISAMFYAWQYLWQTRTPGSDVVGDDALRVKAARHAYQILTPNIDNEIAGASGDEADEMRTMWLCIGEVLDKAALSQTKE